MLGLAKIARSPLRLPAFRSLWLGMVISRLGDQFAIIALLWFVLELTGSGTALALVLLCYSLPAIVTSPLLGRLLDRRQPRLVMVADNVGRALVIGAIPLLFWLGVLHLWMVYALVALAGALVPATGVGVRVVLPHLVPDAELEHANGLASVSEQFSYLAGPGLAGVLVAAFGGPAVLLIDVASFLVMAAFLAALPDVGRGRDAETPKRGRSLFGFGTLLGLKAPRVITVVSVVFFFSYGPLEPALPLYARDTLHAGAAAYGLLWTGFGAGALVGLLAIPFVGRRPRPGVVFATIAVLWGALLSPLVFLTSLPLAVLALGLAGCAWAPYSTVEISLLQRLVPERVRGEAFGARSTVMVAVAPLGVLAGGLLLGVLAAPAVIGVSALACIAAGAGGLLSPPLRAIRRAGGGEAVELPMPAAPSGK